MFEKGHYERVGVELFDQFPEYQSQYESLSTKWQISFLIGLIKDHKFSNGTGIRSVLEVGVYNGVTSLYMLKVGLQKEDFDLYGIEREKSDFFGEAILSEGSDRELEHYHLHKNSTSADIERVLDGNKIDLVFIDAGHTHPHPIIDLIYILPFLHRESIVLLDDVVDYMRPNAWGESFIFTGWTEDKYRAVSLDVKNNEIVGETTLACIEIPEDKRVLYDNILQIAMIPFRASPWQFDDYYLGVNEKDLGVLKMFMEKYYDDDFADTIHKHLAEGLAEYKEKWILLMHETKFYNYLYERRLPGRYDNLHSLRLLESIENLMRKFIRIFIKKRV